MLHRIALPVLMWSISAAGVEERPADPPIVELEVLTVTATKTERPAFEVRASVSIIGPERIESEQPQSIDVLLEELPNVEVDLYASWLPEGAGYSGLQVDFGIDNLTDKSYRRHLSLIDEVGRNFKVAVSYRF